MSSLQKRFSRSFQCNTKWKFLHPKYTIKTFKVVTLQHFDYYPGIAQLSFFGSRLNVLLQNMYNQKWSKNRFFFFKRSDCSINSFYSLIFIVLGHPFCNLQLQFTQQFKILSMWWCFCIVWWIKYCKFWEGLSSHDLQFNMCCGLFLFFFNHSETCSISWLQQSHWNYLELSLTFNPEN